MKGQNLEFEEIKSKVVSGQIVRDNKIILHSGEVDILSFVPNKAEMKKLQELRKKGLFVSLVNNKAVAFVKVYRKKQSVALLESVSARRLEEEKIVTVKDMFPDREVFFYPQLVGEIPERGNFVDVLVKMQYNAGLKSITVLERDAEQDVQDFKKQIEEMQKQYSDAFLLPAIDLRTELTDDSEIPIYEKLKVCESLSFVKTAMTICRGYGEVKQQMSELARASVDFALKLLMAGTPRTISINKTEIAGVDLSKYFGCNGAFLKYPDYVAEDYNPPIKRLSSTKGTYKRLNQTEKEQLARSRDIPLEQLYDFTRIEDIQIFNEIWAEINRAKAKVLLEKRKIAELI